MENDLNASLDGQNKTGSPDRDLSLRDTETINEKLCTAKLWSLDSQKCIDKARASTLEYLSSPAIVQVNAAIATMEESLAYLRGAKEELEDL